MNMKQIRSCKMCNRVLEPDEKNYCEACESQIEMEKNQDLGGNRYE